MTENNGLPPDWKLTTVGDLYQVLSGGTPSTKVEEYWGGDIPWITSANIHGLKDIQPERTVTQAGIDNSATNLVPKGSIIVVTRVSLGKVALAETDICFSQDSQALLPTNKVSPGYALYYLSWAAREFQSKSRGTTISGITKKQLLTLEFPLPPSPEQERIVAKIEELFTQLEAGVAELQQAKAQLQRYRQAVLKSAVEGELTREWRAAQLGKGDSPSRPYEPAEVLLARILSERRAKWAAEGGKGKYKEPAPPDTDEMLELPQGWVWASVDMLCDVIPGYSFKSKDFVETGLPVIKIANIGYGDFLWKQQQYLPKKFMEIYEKFVVKPGTTLLALTRPITNNTVKACAYPAQAENGLLNQRVALLKTNNALNNSLLLFCLQSDFFKSQIKKGMSETLQPNLSPVGLKNFALPLPPQEEQNVIVNKIERRLSVADEIEKELDQALARSERLRQSILKFAFDGKLVRRDGKDKIGVDNQERDRNK